ncbi:MAG: hypothetical protein J2P26_10860 [Nocardiopsaceae bacterium]|nr:hypothetical protein [Nocardiopsaceae bacterium]
MNQPCPSVLTVSVLTVSVLNGTESEAGQEGSYTPSAAGTRETALSRSG